MSSYNGDSPRSNAQEEKILVSIRLRPLNDKEVSYNESVDWECISNTTLMFNNKPPENQNSPAAYSFDRVFGSDCSTRQVYEEAAKSVALSVVSGINSSIFAYGQTSSGKTYTMSGVTQYTIADIYDYIEKNTSRQFTLKFSAMEIYNEAVRDLLSSDGTPLRLLDDPERGTVVERLIEFTLRDRSHLLELLSICEAERKIGETALNEMSSRSHQILRLAVESSPREYNRFENAKNLAATVNFVDLAGSERASQTKSAGTRLKEGCHINRSLLTLGTVIRKLSKSRNGHVPYRDSKLTRILQNSLGGNARTAIICTMSPAHSHLEQSRNTLLFANCAKQVRTNAHVNMMMSEKALIKQLQKELARLEAQLRNIGSLSNSGDSLKEKELLIVKMEDEIRELTQQRDQAHFRLNNFACEPEENRSMKHWDEQSNASEPPQEKLAWFEDYSASETSETHFSDKSEGRILNKSAELFPEPPEEQFLSNDTSPRMFLEKYFGPDPTRGWEKTAAQKLDASSEDIICKEVQCIEVDTRNMSLDSENQENIHVNIPHESEETLKEDAQKSINPEPSPSTSDVDLSEEVLTTMPSKQDEDETPSIEVKESLESSSTTTDPTKEDETPSNVVKESLESLSPPKEDETQSIVVKEALESVNPEPAHGRDLSLESVDSDCAEEKPEIIMSMRLDDHKVMKSEEQFKSDLVKEAESILPPNKLEESSVNDPPKSPASWAMEFEKQRSEIIQLWETCHIPLVHRSYFFLVFKGDPSDAIYLEVELRRLSYLKESKNDRNHQVSSLKELNRERHMLSRMMLKKLSTKEREALFQKWGVGVKTKRRRNQLCKKLWTNTNDMEHIKESAALIGKLVGLVELSQARKEIVGLSFSAPQVNLHVRSFSWIPSLV